MRGRWAVLFVAACVEEAELPPDSCAIASCDGTRIRTWSVDCVAERLVIGVEADGWTGNDSFVDLWVGEAHEEHALCTEAVHGRGRSRAESLEITLETGGEALTPRCVPPTAGVTASTCADFAAGGWNATLAIRVTGPNGDFADCVALGPRAAEVGVTLLGEDGYVDADLAQCSP